MKTYTLIWKAYPSAFYYGRTFCRVRFDSLCSLWNANLPNDKIMQFVFLISRPAFCLDNSYPSCCRLIKCGKLVARQATYQGVA